ncbi:MAG: hypothetical protein NZZ41_01735 [Candidatus Dojkabacteria bacterium]|nr:hypothetical protein [Candidatus Dojkabacteria bacterium]
MKKYNIHKDDILNIPDLQFSQDNIKRKKVNSIRKGKNFERFIAKDLSKRFNERFIRVPCSGGLMGGQINVIKNKFLSEEVKKMLSGDIICPKWFPFILEVKNYYDNPKFSSIFKNKDNYYLNKWIFQAQQESAIANKHWLIIFKVTTIRKGIFCLFDEHLFNLCNKPNIKYIKYKNYIILPYQIFWDIIFPLIKK